MTLQNSMTRVGCCLAVSAQLRGRTLQTLRIPLDAFAGASWTGCEPYA
jgi:hypothetical protein